MRVDEVMTRDVRVIPPHSTIQDAADAMKAFDIGPLPVCEGSQVVGMLTDRDITVRAVAEGRDLWETRVRDVMTPEVVCCFDDQEVAEAFRLMTDYQVRRLPVLNRNHRLVGILSLGDLAEKIGEEVVAGNLLEEAAKPDEARP